MGPDPKRRRERWDDQFHELDRRAPARGERLEQLVRGLKMRTPSPLQDYVLARLAGQTGPSWLDGQSLEQAVRTTELLGVLVAFGPKLDLNRLPEADWDRAGAVGYRFTSRGESGIREALGLAQAAFEGKGKPGRRKVFGHLYEWLLSKRTTQDPGEIKRILREHIFETMEVATGEIILGEPLDRRRLHSVESLAKEQGLDARTLRNVLIARNLIPSTASVEGYHLFNAALGEEVAASVKRGIHVISMPDALNCTRPQFDQLVHERILTPISRGGHVARGRTHKAFDGEHVAEFLWRLRERAEPAAAKPKGFVPIAKAAEKAKVPCIDIVHLILGGFLENVVRLAGTEGYSAVLVDAAEVKKVTKSVMIGMSAADAFEALAVPASTGWTLVDRQDELRLKSVVIEGANGYRFHRFDRAEVDDYARRFATDHGIAATLGNLKTNIERKLKAARVKPVLSRPEIIVDLYRVRDLPSSLGYSAQA